MGASAAFADATPRPASRLIRTVIIAMMRRRRETRCMKPKPLHQTPSGINTACLIKFFRSESRPLLSASSALHCRSQDESQPSSRRSPLFTLPPSSPITHKPSHSPTTMDFLVEEKRLFPAIIRNREHRRKPSGLGGSMLLNRSARVYPFQGQRRGMHTCFLLLSIAVDGSVVVGVQEECRLL